MRRHPQIPTLLHEIQGVKPFVALSPPAVCREASPTSPAPRRVAFGRAIGLKHFGVHDQSVAVLHQQVPGRGREATLHEMYPAPEEWVATGPEGHFQYEIVVPFFRHKSSSQPSEG